MGIDFKNEDALYYVSSLGDSSIDLCLTDPPYAVSRKTNFSSGDETGRDTDRFRVSYEFGEWDEVDLDYFSVLFEKVYAKLRKGGTCIVFYDLWKVQELRGILEEVGFKQFRFIEWVKTNPVPINSKINYLTNSREVAIVCVKGSKPTFNSSYDKGIYEYPIYQGKDRFHTTQKPIKLMEELINKHSNKGDNVLDMFCGSATTLVACINSDRSGYGCEKQEDYYNKAKVRLGEYYDGESNNNVDGVS